MRLAVVLIVLAGCGGDQTPPPKEPAPPPPKVTRIPVEQKDDEPEDGVTFVKTKGAMSKEAIEAGLAPHKQAMEDCYTKKVGKRRWLGGHIVLHWDIKANGEITAVKLVEGTLGAWSVEQCLIEIAWAANFEKPSGGDADFTLPLDFSARSSTQIWDEDKALKAIGGQLSQLDDCPDLKKAEKKKRPEKAAKKKKKPPNKPAESPDEKPERPEKPPHNVVITMYVGPQGKAKSIGFASPTSQVGPRWAQCADKVASSWRLPDPRGQIAKLAIRYKAD